MQQPLAGAQPTTVGGALAAGQQQIAPITAAGPVTAPTGFSSPAATTATGFTPIAGNQAGSVAASGGLVDDGLPRTAAIAAGVAGNAYANGLGAGQAAAVAAGQQVVSPAAMQPAPGATAPAGPAAWGEKWAKKFKDAGAPAEMIQQLTFTGAMGADEAQLQQMLDQVKGEIDTQLAKFAHDHPDEFKKLRGNASVDRSMVAQIAAGVNAGQVPKAQLHQLVESAGKSQGKAMFDMLVKPMIVWSLIPGWGAIRLASAPLTGGKDPLTGEKMFGDPMMTTFSILAGIGGSITLFNHARGAMQVAQGHRLMQAGGDAARIAAAEGFGNLKGMQKLQSFVPGTNANKVFAGISRLDSNLDDGLKALKAGSVERELAQNVLNKWRAGEISIVGDSASKWTKLGYQPNTRGIILGRNKAMAATKINHGNPSILLDGRMTGKMTVAHLASAGVEFADDTVASNMLKSRVFQGKGSPLDPAVVKSMREQVLGNATQQMLDAKFISRPNGFGKVMGALRPGPLQDALWAANNVGAGTIGKLHGTAAIPKFAKFGVPGALAVAGMGFMTVKMRKDAAKQAEAAAAALAKQQGQAGGAAPQSGGQVQPPELQAALQQFGALPSEQQAQIIQQQYATLQQAAQQPNLTPEQQQEIAAAASELELFMQVANGGAAAGGTQPPAAAAAQPQAQQPAAAGAGAGFTARGLGLG